MKSSHALMLLYGRKIKNNHPDKVWVQYCSNFDYWAPRRDSEFDIGNSLDFNCSNHES